MLDKTSPENLFVGIDIGKFRHHVRFISKAILDDCHDPKRCPRLEIEQSREGFSTLLEYMQAFQSLDLCIVIMERTGPYHRPLEAFLQEHNIKVFVIHPPPRNRSKEKSDSADALSLAYRGFLQVGHKVLPENPKERLEQAVPPAPDILLLRPLARHRYEISQEITRRKQQLVAICDELFPELTQVFKDPNLPGARAIRLHFPTPNAIATASMTDLRSLRVGRHPGDKKLESLQALARLSIGVKCPMRQEGLALEQSQLIKELTMLEEHMAEIDAAIKPVIRRLREGQILLSFPGIGDTNAAILLSTIGHIDNFSSPAKLRAYLGWAPLRNQTGISRDRMALSPAGNRMTRRTLFLVVLNAVKADPYWATLYRRLVEQKCPYDPRLGRHIGKTKVIGRIAGQIIEIIYTLLKRDSVLIQASPPGLELPPPELYNSQHRTNGSNL